jgi:hypothetical protein
MNGNEVSLLRDGVADGGAQPDSRQALHRRQTAADRVGVVLGLSSNREVSPFVPEWPERSQP